MDKKKKSEDKTVQTNHHSLERQIIRSSFYTHTTIGKQSERINEIESFLYGLSDLMIKKGIVLPEELATAAEDVRNEMFEKGEQVHAGVGIRIDKSEKDREFIPVNCDERIHICKAICCKLNFPLSVEEIESGNVKWDLGQPYFIRHEENGYCSHLNTKNKCCSIYNNRPGICRKYSCANDKRIWKDFDNIVLNQEWIESNLKESKIRLQAIYMIPEDKIELDS